MIATISKFAAVALLAAHALTPKRRVLVLGGTGRIGTAVAIRLLQREPSLEVQLAGRDARRGRAAVAEVASEADGRCEFVQLNYERDDLVRAFAGVDAVVHVAGPFDGPRALEPLKRSLEAEVPIYVDVSDPIEYLEAAQALPAPSTAALLCAGAFPGMSNVLAVEAASRLDARPKDLNFSYFTAGLGGSGVVNLDITNYGFGPPTPRWVDGKAAATEAFAGTDCGTAEFDVVGTRDVWAWPFPEARTVAAALDISGSARAGMGTAPGAWNWMLRFLVAVVPRNWWSSETFSGGMARFSEPLVKVTDAFVGEAHAMRVDVSSEAGASAVALQSHESFRRCVGQSCAEFALDMLRAPPPAGVYLPEVLYAEADRREAVLGALTSTPGTTAFRVLES